MREEDDRVAVRVWLGTLIEREIVHSRGRTRGTEYFVNPEILRSTGYQGATTLKKIAPHRLRHLVLEDLAIYAPDSSRGIKISAIHRRVGLEISRDKLSRCLEQLRADQHVDTTGLRGSTRYFIRRNPAI